MNGKTLIVAVLGLALPALLGGCYSRSGRAAAKETAVAQGSFETAPVASEEWVIVPEGVEYAEPAIVMQDTPAEVPVARPTPVKPTVAKYSGSGFNVYEEDGRYWVFEAGSDAEAGYLRVGEPAKSVTKIGVGPEGRTVRSSDTAVIAKWLSAVGVKAPKAMPEMAFKFVRPGFAVYEEDTRLWIFMNGSKAHKMFLKVGEPAKSVTKIGDGPEGRTVRSDESSVVDSYMAAWKYGRPGFAVFSDDGRLWILREGSDDLATFLRVGEPAKSVTRIGVGPAGETIRSSDLETINDWTTAWMAR